MRSYLIKIKIFSKQLKNKIEAFFRSNRIWTYIYVAGTQRVNQIENSDFDQLNLARLFYCHMVPFDIKLPSV